MEGPALGLDGPSLVTWLSSAEALGHHPTELALSLSLVLSLVLTLGIRFTESSRRYLKGALERHPQFLRGRGVSIFGRVEDALVLLALGLLGILGGSAVFLQVVEALQDSQALSQWDTRFVDTVHHTVTRGEVAFFSAITPLAGIYPPIVLGVLVGCWLGVRRQRLLAWIWISGLVGNSLLAHGLKQFFRRERPVFEAPLLVENNFSFPSGHAMTSILLYGLLAYVLSRQLPAYSSIHRHFIVWLVTFLGCLIGTSRLVLGVHYPSDVLAGWSVGSAWLALLVLLAEGGRGRFRLSR